MRDLRMLEQEVRDLRKILGEALRPPTVHQVWTAPLAHHDAVSPFVQVHSVADEVLVVPIPLFGRIHLRRLSAIIGNDSEGATTYGMAIYRSVTLNPDNGASPILPPNRELRLAAPGVATQISVTDGSRFNADINHQSAGELILDGERAQYYVGFTASDATKARWFCPNHSDTTEVDGSFSTDGVCSPSGVFPGTVHVTGDIVAKAPAIVLRSPRGLLHWGDLTEDG